MCFLTLWGTDVFVFWPLEGSTVGAVSDTGFKHTCQLHNITTLSTHKPSILYNSERKEFASWLWMLTERVVAGEDRGCCWRELICSCSLWCEGLMPLSLRGRSTPHPQVNWKPELIHLSCIHVLSYNHICAEKTGCEIIVQNQCLYLWSWPIYSVCLTCCHRSLVAKDQTTFEQLGMWLLCG